MEKKIKIKVGKEFSIKQIAESGQTFRWDKLDDGFVGVAFGHVIKVTQKDDEITIEGSNYDEYIKIWEKYFDIDRDYSLIMNEFRGKDKYLDAAIKFGFGIRILNQDLWEMIISFIISGNNNIPRIKNSIKLISERYGDFICEKNGEKYYSFPSPEQLCLANIEDLRNCGVGYRDSYIYKTTQMIINKEVDLEVIKNMSLIDGRKELKKLLGVGDKVADCVLLFSCNKANAFPIDTWVKKILAEYYKVDKTTVKDVNEFAQNHFGKYCGIAQQYLFYYIRNN